MTKETTVKEILGNQYGLCVRLGTIKRDEDYDWPDLDTPKGKDFIENNRELFFLD